MNRQIDKFGRITIPSEIRNELNLNIGDFLRIESDGSRIIITAQKKYDINEYIALKKKELDGSKEITKEMVLKSFDDIINEINKKVGI